MKPVVSPRLFIAAKWVMKRLASDPRARAKAAEMFEKEVKPRAAQAWHQGKPRFDAAKRDIQEIAREVDPRKDPGRFVAKLKRRFFDRDGRR